MSTAQGHASPAHRTSLVTGASSGIGAAFAQALAARGDHVVLVARDEMRLKELAARLPSTTEVLVADLADRRELQRVEHRLGDPTRPVHLLVNNAAAATYGPLVELDPEVLTREVDLDVLAVVRLTRAVLPGLLERGTGGVLNVSSTASTGVAPQLAAYAASKAFVDSWTRSLADAVRGTGVTVTCVRPGYIRTRFHHRAGQDVSHVPGTYWLEPEQVVTQALAAFERGLVTFVPRPDPVTRARALTRRRLTRLRDRLPGRRR